MSISSKLRSAEKRIEGKIYFGEKVLRPKFPIEPEYSPAPSVRSGSIFRGVDQRELTISEINDEVAALFAGAGLPDNPFLLGMLIHEATSNVLRYGMPQLQGEETHMTDVEEHATAEINPDNFKVEAYIGELVVLGRRILSANLVLTDSGPDFPKPPKALAAEAVNAGLEAGRGRGICMLIKSGFEISTKRISDEQKMTLVRKPFQPTS